MMLRQWGMCLQSCKCSGVALLLCVTRVVISYAQMLQHPAVVNQLRATKPPFNSNISSPAVLVAVTTLCVQQIKAFTNLLFCLFVLAAWVVWPRTWL